MNDDAPEVDRFSCECYRLSHLPVFEERADEAKNVIVMLIVFLPSRRWAAHGYVQGHHQGWCILWGGGEGEELFLLCLYICLIRHHGCYLFPYAIWCSFCLRVTTNREWRLLNSGKSFVNVRALRKPVCKITDAVTWFWIWSKPSGSLLQQSGAYTAPPIRFLIFFFQWFHSVPQTSLDSSLGTQPSHTHVLQ